MRSLKNVMRVTDCFLFSAGVLLLLTGVAKLVSSFGSGGILHTRDPVLGLSFQNLFIIAGCTEVMAASLCFFCKNAFLAAAVVAWLSTSILVYRVGVVWVGYHTPCRCLGTLTDALHIAPQMADILMRIILVYLLIGSYGTLCWLWCKSHKIIPTELGG